LQGVVPTDQPTPDGNGTVTGAVSRIAHHVIAALSPQFLALIIINMMFLGVFVWHVDARADHTVDVIQQLLNSCLEKK
jgi:hypothetical protein